MKRAFLFGLILFVFLNGNAYSQNTSSNTPRTFEMERCYVNSPLDQPTCLKWEYYFKLEIKLKNSAAAVDELSKNRSARGFYALQAALTANSVERYNTLSEGLSRYPSLRPSYLQELRSKTDRVLFVNFNQNVTSKDLDYWKRVFAGDPNVEGVYYSSVPKIQETESADPLRQYQWSLPRVNAFLAHRYTLGSPDVYATILDTGVGPHEDLPKLCYDINVIDPGRPAHDDLGHGTHVAGIIAAQHNNKGIAGLAPLITLCSVKVLNEYGSGTWEEVSMGTLLGVDQTREIKASNPYAQFLFNYSLGGPGPIPSLDIAFAEAYKEGVHIFAAAGNSQINIDRISFYPASAEGVIPVVATDQFDKPAEFTSYTRKRRAVAFPGINILSTVPVNVPFGDPTGYRPLSGTSMSSPGALASAALTLSEVMLTREQMFNLIEGSAEVLPVLKNFLPSSARHNMALMHNLPDVPPVSVANLELASKTHSIANFHFTLPPDSAGEKASGFLVFSSTKPFDENSLNEKWVQVRKVRSSREAAGDEVDFSLELEKPDTEYHFAVKVFDRMNAASPLSRVVSFSANPAKVYSAYSFTMPDGQKDSGDWTVAKGPLADTFKTPGGKELLWHLSSVASDGPKPRWDWRFGREDFLDYLSAGPADGMVKSGILDFRGFRGASLVFDYFLEIAFASEADIFEIYAFEFDDSGRIVKAHLVKQFTSDDNSKKLGLSRLVLDLARFVEGKKFQLGFRFLPYSAGENGGIGAIFGNVFLNTDK